MSEEYDDEARALDAGSHINGLYLSAGPLTEPGVAVMSETGTRIFFAVQRCLKIHFAAIRAEYGAGPEEVRALVAAADGLVAFTYREDTNAVKQAIDGALRVKQLEAALIPWREPPKGKVSGE